MRIIDLLGHAGDLRPVQEQRQPAEEELAAYEKALAHHRAATAAARSGRSAAWLARDWPNWLRGVRADWGERRRLPRSPVRYGGEAGLAPGEPLAGYSSGGQPVEGGLGSVLGDDWMLFRGYSNPSGAIDHLLLGPQGLFALLTEDRAATVYIDGDEWQYDEHGTCQMEWNIRRRYRWLRGPPVTRWRAWVR